MKICKEKIHLRKQDQKVCLLQFELGVRGGKAPFENVKPQTYASYGFEF